MIHILRLGQKADHQAAGFGREFQMPIGPAEPVSDRNGPASFPMIEYFKQTDQLSGVIQIDAREDLFLFVKITAACVSYGGEEMSSAFPI